MIFTDVGNFLPDAIKKTAKPAKPFENYRTDISTTMGFLLGMSDESLGNSPDIMKPELVEKLKKNDEACVIRSLCALRKSFLCFYEKIKAERYKLRPIEDMTEYVNAEDILYLRGKGVEVAFVNVKNCNEPAIYIAYINQYILERIDRVRSLFPDWIKFDYVRSLFLMPGAYAGHRGENVDNVTKQKKMTKTVNDVKFAYRQQFDSYPYHMWLNWPRDFKETEGNILLNDSKFLKLLYAANGDMFAAKEYLIDVKSEKKESIYSFIDKAEKISVFVDCENVSPYSFVAMLLNLDAESLNKINKIILYDDENTSKAWEIVSGTVDIPVEHNEFKRVLEEKSLIDIAMTAGVCREFYKESTESIILASSDSDFWGCITSLPEARFYVMNESTRTSPAIIEKLDEHGIEHCFMDAFAQDKVQDFKTKAILSALTSRINGFNETGVMFTTDVNELVDGLFKECYVMGNPMQIKQEKEQFYKKFLRQGLLLKPEEGDDGAIILRMELNRTK